MAVSGGSSTVRFLCYHKARGHPEYFLRPAERWDLRLQDMRSDRPGHMRFCTKHALRRGQTGLFFYEQCLCLFSFFLHTVDAEYPNE